MLKSIAIVTIMVQQLGSIEVAYQKHFDYQSVGRGEISGELAAIWDAPAIKGSPYLLMQPANQAAVYLRFIEAEETLHRFSKKIKRGNRGDNKRLAWIAESFQQPTINDIRYEKK